MSDPFPVVIDSSGLVPQTPQQLLDALIALVSDTNPGYTATLPGSLIRDIASTDVGALTICDAAKVDTVDSLTPYGANVPLINQLGAQAGVEQQSPTNTSALVIIDGPPGFPISQGFTISDGSHQYVVQDGSIIGSGGVTNQLFVLATVTGSWAVPANSIVDIVTSLPMGISLSVTNPQAGTPSAGEEPIEDYQAAVIQAGLAVSTGVPTMVKTVVAEVPGVQRRLISMRTPTSGKWEVIVGGGDPYQVAFAIFSTVLDLSTLTGSVLAVTGVSSAAAAVVTLNLNHGYASGQVAVIAGVVSMTGVNGSHIATVIDEKSFSIPVNTTLETYTTGGTVTPNFRNQTVSIFDAPDTYSIPYVTPPQQAVGITLTWNTSSPNYVNPDSVAALGAAGLVAYVNSIQVGQPMNLFELQAAFQASVSTLIPTPLLTRMVFVVEINSVVTAPASGTGIIAGDPESYFFTDTTQIAIAQG